MSYGSALRMHTPSSPLAIITLYYIRESDNNVFTTLKCLMIMDLRFVRGIRIRADQDTGRTGR
jgi:hypothetical protein